MQQMWTDNDHLGIAAGFEAAEGGDMEVVPQEVEFLNTGQNVLGIVHETSELGSHLSAVIDDIEDSSTEQKILNQS